MSFLNMFPSILENINELMIRAVEHTGVRIRSNRFLRFELFIPPAQCFPTARKKFSKIGNLVLFFTWAFLCKGLKGNSI